MQYYKAKEISRTGTAFFIFIVGGTDDRIQRI